MCGTKREWEAAELDVLRDIVVRVMVVHGHNLVYEVMLDLLTHNQLHETRQMKQEEKQGIL